MAYNVALLQPSSLRGAPHVTRAAPACRGAFFGGCQRLRAARPQQRRRTALSAQAFQAEWPDPEFIKETKAAFPEKGVATVEEARVLYSEDGYTYLDVRPELEVQEVGKVKGSVNIPIMNATRKYDPEQKKKVTQKSPNEAFADMVKKRFPDPETKLLVACSDGRKYSMDALTALDEAGYVNIAGLKGGYYAWFRVFDNKLKRRVTGEYAEQYTHDGDSCGIHSSGAGFPRMDTADKWVPPAFE